MRYIFNIALLSIMLFSCANAQDLLYMKNHNTKKVKVVGISRNWISYKDYDDPEGQVKRLPKDDVDHLVYEDGRVEVYSRLDASGRFNIDASGRFNIDDYWRFVRQFSCDSLNQCSYKKGQFYYMDKKLSEKEIDYAMRNCCPGSLQLYESGRHIRVWGVMATFIGAFLLQTEALAYSNGNENLIACGVGAGHVVVGVPLWIVGQRRVKRSLDMVGEKCPNQTASHDPIRLDFTPKDNGLGMSLKF